MAEGKKSRKHGNNKVSCKRYEVECRLTKNKKRTAQRVAKEKDRKDAKMLLRIKRGKPVPSRWLVLFADEVPL